MVEVVEVFLETMAEIGAENEEGAAGPQHAPHGAEDIENVFARPAMLEEIAHEGRVKRVGRHHLGERFRGRQMHGDARRGVLPGFRVEVDGDTFGACLTAKGWWPEEHIPTLVDEYVLAMRLLEQYDGPIAFTP